MKTEPDKTMAMKRISITVSANTAKTLKELGQACTASNESTNGANTHGSLSVTSLLSMLAEDAAMVITRPGSWEGSNMAQVFSSHGYEV